MVFPNKVSFYVGLIVCAASACGEVPPTAQVTDEIVVTTPGLDHAMVRVAAGAFIMGSEDGLDDEGPIHQVHVDAFSIDKFEVTNEKFSAYVEATGVQPSTLSGSDAFDGLRHPVVGIVWEEASSYCKWAGLRLPSEAEWEKAARGETGQTYPWGDSLPSRSLLQYLDSGPAAVGSFPAGQSPFGAEDMSGNVWEYVRDHYVKDYYRFGPERNPVAIVGDGEPDHTIRGGSWASTPDEVRATRRWRVFLIETDLPESQVGFRCAKN